MLKFKGIGIKIAFIGICIMIIILISSNMRSFTRIDNQSVPKNGFVPDEETAKKIAEAIWIPIYGKDVIDGEKPFQAELWHDTVWVVNGTLPKGYSGGTAYITIRKSDCKISDVYHDK
jgi:hypothetical protein